MLPIKNPVCKIICDLDAASTIINTTCPYGLMSKAVTPKEITPSNGSFIYQYDVPTTKLERLGCGFPFSDEHSLGNDWPF